MLQQALILLKVPKSLTSSSCSASAKPGLSLGRPPNLASPNTPVNTAQYSACSSQQVWVPLLHPDPHPHPTPLARDLGLQEKGGKTPLSLSETSSCCPRQALCSHVAALVLQRFLPQANVSPPNTPFSSVLFQGGCRGLIYFKQPPTTHGHGRGLTLLQMKVPSRLLSPKGLSVLV